MNSYIQPRYHYDNQYNGCTTVTSALCVLLMQPTHHARLLNKTDIHLIVALPFKCVFLQIMELVNNQFEKGFTKEIVMINTTYIRHFAQLLSKYLKFIGLSVNI